MNDVVLPLEGVRVVEVAQVLAAPYVASLLGDLGADVVKVERPEGDLIRPTDALLRAGGSAYFASANRNKRYLTVDLKDPVDRRRLNREIAECDVLVTNGRPGAVHRAGLDYEAVRALRPDVVYCLVTAFGESGPRCEEPGMDLTAQALAGLMGTTGEPDGPPAKTSSPVGDYSAALFAVQGVLAALYRRTRTGQGAKVGVNLLDASLAMLGNYVPQVSVTGVDLARVGSGHQQLVPYQAFPDAHGEYFVVACLTQKFWELLCTAIDRPEWRRDTRFLTNTDRRNHRALLVGELTALFATRPRAEWIALLGARGVPTCEVNSLTQALEDPQVRHNGIVVQTPPDDVHGVYRFIGNPLLLDDERLPVRSTAQPLAPLPRSALQTGAG
ncbi:CoA transferase [Pseudonocardia xishanensis]|uniref:CaiB/BaiF CoA transferase family protein n=1 Tax=Pseudonocardia xishanensis TaxID=630995 RepID=UPI0031F010B0